MNAESSSAPRRRRDSLSTEDSEALSLAVLGRIVADETRLSRFLALSGLDPDSIRQAATEPGLLVGVLDHVLEDEGLLLAIASDLCERPERIVEARHRLSPDPDWGD